MHPSPETLEAAIVAHMFQDSPARCYDVAQVGDDLYVRDFTSDTPWQSVHKRNLDLDDYLKRCRDNFGWQVCKVS